MRYMMIVKGPEDLTESGPPPAELFEAVEKLIAEEAKTGKLVSFGGLQPTATGARLRIRKGKIVTTDGPFAESKEVIGGFSIFEFASKEEAVAEARKLLELHRDYWPAWEGEVEIRPMYGQDDDVRAAQLEASRRLEQTAGASGSTDG